MSPIAKVGKSEKQILAKPQPRSKFQRTKRKELRRKLSKADVIAGGMPLHFISQGRVTMLNIS